MTYLFRKGNSMIIALPIMQSFSNKQQAWKHVSAQLPIDLAMMAEMVLYFNEDRKQFANEVTNWIYSVLDDEVIEDNDLTKFNERAIFSLLKSPTFELFLITFYDEHKALYDNLLGIKPALLEWEQIYDNSGSGQTKLILNVERIP